jgi:hypothetical protein
MGYELKVEVPEWDLMCLPHYNNPVSNDFLTTIRESNTKHSTQQPTNSTDREKK